MSCVHYKFSSKLDYNTVTFDGLHITLSELKRQIMGRERLKATDCDLQITNAQTREGELSADCQLAPNSGTKGDQCCKCETQACMHCQTAVK